MGLFGQKGHLASKKQSTNKLNIAVAGTEYIRLSTRHTALPASPRNGDECYPRKGGEAKQAPVSYKG